MPPALIDTFRRYFFVAVVEDFDEACFAIRMPFHGRGEVAQLTDGQPIPYVRLHSTDAAYRAVQSSPGSTDLAELASWRWNTRDTADQMRGALHDLLCRCTWMRERYIDAPPAHGFHSTDAACRSGCALLRALLRLIDSAMAPGGEALRTPAFWADYAAAVSGRQQHGFWRLWWLCACGQLPIAGAGAAGGDGISIIMISAVEALGEAARALFPSQRAACLDALDRHLEDNARAVTGIRSFRLAIDMLGLRQHMEERIS